jgi:hypothetical protein
MSEKLATKAKKALNKQENHNQSALKSLYKVQMSIFLEIGCDGRLFLGSG